jgi:AcrR family transcriptional regulator
MSSRKQQILQQAVELIASKGYAAFTMRAVARESGLTLGALQYHYPTQEVLLRALADYIGHQYRESFRGYFAELDEGVSLLQASLDFALMDPADDLLQADRLFPQLWAMALVEPIMEELLNALYEEYLLFVEACLREQGVAHPRADALALMAMFEGFMLFNGRGRRWEAHAPATIEAIRKLIIARFGS